MSGGASSATDAGDWAADRGEEGVSQRIGYTRWLPSETGEGLRHDLMAGLTVAVMLIPQSMAYAHLAGLPPIHGLYASIVPLLVYPFFGTSLHLAVGVVTIDMLVVRAGLSPLAEPGTAAYVELALLLGLMVGIIQVVMGLGRMGFLVNLLSRPVMVGFTSGAAILIAMSQLGALTGMDMEGARILPSLAWAAARHAGELHGPSLAMGLGATGVLLGIRYWKPSIPGSLVVVVVGTGLVAAFGLDDGFIEVIGAVPAGLPTPTFPTSALSRAGALLPTALALALIQFVSVISLGKVFAAQFRYSIRPNREFGAIGAANIAAGLFRGLPVSGSFSRSAVNVEAGAKTPLSNMVAAAVVAVALLLLTPALGLIPVPVLGAIIVVAALGLLDVEEMRLLLRAKTVDGWIAILTFVATLTTGILQGILVGVVASVLAVLYRISRPNTAELGHLPGTRSFRDVRGDKDTRMFEGILMLRVDASFSFMNAEFLKDLILKRTAHEEEGVDAVVVDASSINDLDTTAAHVLIEVKEILDARGIDLYFGGTKEPVMAVLRRSGLMDELDEESFFLSPHRAVTHILTGWDEHHDYLDRVPGGDEHRPAHGEG